MADNGGVPAPGAGESIFRKLLLWEKAVWVVIIIYFLIVFWVFWILGWSKLPFPV